ncbi:MAG: response regulator [Geobacter sp.]|nr:response regulator [Geobacter sp.]
MFMKKILLVDDVKLLIEIQKKFLASSSVQIITASDGAEALEKVRRELPDLIVMDKYMPVMNGLDCCKAIKADPAIAHIPVIMASNATSEEDMQEYQLAGCSEVLSKPLEAKLFLNAVKKYIPEIERRGGRIPVDFQMKILANGLSYEATMENLSLNGVFAITGINAEINDVLKFTFKLPESDIPMEVKGRVVWHRNSGGAHGFGVEFMEVVGQGVSLLRINELKAFISAKLAAVKQQLPDGEHG